MRFLCLHGNGTNSNVINVPQSEFAINWILSVNEIGSTNANRQAFLAIAAIYSETDLNSAVAA